MAQKQQKEPPKKKKQKLDYHRIVVTIFALFLALMLVLPMITMIIGGAGAVSQSDIDALKRQQNEYQQKLADLKNQLSQVKSDQAAAMQKKDILMQQLSAIEQEISNIDAQISYYDSEIAQKEQEEADARAREQEQYKVFCERVRSMEEEGEVSYWAILFNADDFSDLLDRVMVINDVMDYDQALMDQLVATREEIERLKAELETSRDAQKEARAQQELRRQEQSQKVAETNKVLAEINANVSMVNEMLDKEYAEEARIGKEIVKKQKELEAQRKKNNVTFVTGSGYLWPLSGHTALTSVFGGRIHPITGKYSTHTGIDIPAPSGTPIRASKGGQVVTSTNNGGTYGRYVVIDHGNGNSTLYAHMSSRNCSEGDIVKQGDVIGYVGTTGRSTGNHLHLEIRQNYSRVDPQKVFSNIPFTYR